MRVPRSKLVPWSVCTAGGGATFCAASHIVPTESKGRAQASPRSVQAAVRARSFGAPPAQQRASGRTGLQDQSSRQGVHGRARFASLPTHPSHRAIIKLIGTRGICHSRPLERVDQVKRVVSGGATHACGICWPATLAACAYPDQSSGHGRFARLAAEPPSVREATGCRRSPWQGRRHHRDQCKQPCGLPASLLRRRGSC
jgi:hypothetical protein